MEGKGFGIVEILLVVVQQSNRQTGQEQGAIDAVQNATTTMTNTTTTKKR